jgi:RNA polymerase sigma factor for flagellar operon FliA
VNDPKPQEALRAWLADKSEQRRDAVLESWAPLVKRVWSRMRVSLPPSAQALAEDLVQAGCIGLIQALDGFDPRAGAAFETYAWLRIRGAMLDEMRRQDWLSKQARQRWKELQKASVEITQASGQPASEEELAQRLGLDVESLRQRLLECSPATLVFLDGLAPGTGAGTGLHERIADDTQAAPDESSQREELKRALAAAIGELPRQQRDLLQLLLEDGLGQKEAAEVMGLTPARISQIYAKTVLHLQARLLPLF